MTFKNSYNTTTVEDLLDKSFNMFSAGRFRGLEKDTVLKLFETIGLYHSETATHCLHVASLGRRIAVRLGIAPSRVSQVVIGSLLHDIGIIGISEEILRKKANWSREEAEEYSKHVVLGVDIIRPISLLEKASPFVESHHEYLDGSGYPKHLRGDAIPLDVRIVTVINDYDSLVNGLTHGKAYSEDEAITYIRENSGLLYDSAITEAVLTEIQDGSWKAN